MGDIRVERLSPHSAELWDRFVWKEPAATFFHLSGWKTAIERSIGHECPYLIATRDGVASGIFPLVHLRTTFFGHSLVSMAFCAYGGPVAADAETAKALEGAARELANQLGVDYLEYRLQRPSGLQRPVEAELYATFRKTLPTDADSAFRMIPRKRRAELRKALSAKLTVSVDRDIDRFYALYATNVHRHGTPVLPRRYFRMLSEVFGKECEVTSVFRGGDAIASLLTFYFRDCVLPYYAGGLAVARDLAAHDLIYWDVMCRAMERRVHIFDFGRSKHGTGAFLYKRTWGFEPTPLHYEYLLLRRSSIPRINPLNPRYRLLISLWKRLPLAVANALGPRIARDLG